MDSQMHPINTMNTNIIIIRFFRVTCSSLAGWFSTPFIFPQQEFFLGTDLPHDQITVPQYQLLPEKYM